MTRKLKISDSLSLPLDAVTQKMAALGISGSGKTYGTGKLVECLLDAGAQVVIVDTIGNWSGLRLDADGKSPGIAIPILGGAKGDIALDSHHGRLAAETVASTAASLILDVSDFTGGELRRFATDFAIELLRMKKRHPSPLMVVWEECQDIVPQRVMGDVATMVGAVEKLIKKGRNYGVGTILISHRAAAVNKDVLNQIETLFCFRQNAKHDRKAIQDWIVHQSIDVGGLANELPTLETGTCFCWSPQWLGILEKMRFGKKRTFDASATPEFGVKVRAGELAPVDLEKFKKSMAGAIEKTKADDPKELRRRIVELERDATKKPKTIATPAKVETKLKTVEVKVPVLSKEQTMLMKRLENILAKAGVDLAKAGKDLGKMAAAVEKNATEAAAHREKLLGKIVKSAPPVQKVAQARPTVLAVPRTVPDRQAKAAAQSNGAVAIPPARQKILNALAFLEGIGIERADRTQLGMLSDQSPTSSGYSNNLSALRTAGLLDYPGEGRVQLTEEGRGLAHADNVPSTTEELHEVLRRKIPPARWRILEPLIAAYPKDMEREALGEAAQQSPTSSGYSNNLSALRSLGLIEYSAKGRVVAQPVLFIEGR